MSCTCVQTFIEKKEKKKRKKKKLVVVACEPSLVPRSPFMSPAKMRIPLSEYFFSDDI